MSLIQRKPRPLGREAGSLRDDRLFIVACDDTYAPKQYFDSFRLPRVQIHVVPTEDGTSTGRHVLERLLAFAHEEDDERWMLLDTDHCTRGGHLTSFLKALQEARQNGVQVALSKPCFELWLLLHHTDESDVRSLPHAKAVECRLREKIEHYDKSNIKPEDFPLGSVVIACRRAERLDLVVTGGDIPSENTTRVYRLWKAIAAKALPSQLPAGLRDLLS